MCLQNLTLQLYSTGEDSDYRKLDGEFERSFDNDTGRYQWTNMRDTDFRWYYRVNEVESDDGEVSYTYNWVYSENKADRVACAPGYVEAPLYCTTFVYAGSYENGSSMNPLLSKDHLGLVDSGGVDTTWKLGGCAATGSPTVEPTREPTDIPTMVPTREPTNIPRCPKDYIFTATDEDTTVIMNCPFGWIGSQIERYCRVGGTWTTVSDNCSLLSLVPCTSIDGNLWIF